MQQVEMLDLEAVKDELHEVVKPFQQEQNRRQKRIDFLKKCIRCMERSDFFQIDELLKSKLVQDISEDPHFAQCQDLFSTLKRLASEQIDLYRVEFVRGLEQLAQEAGLPLKVDFPRFEVLKGIEGSIDFGERKTTINQVILKSIDPRRIVSTASKIKQKLHDSPFDPQAFIDALFQCYTDLLKKMGGKLGDIVPIRQFYTEFVLSQQTRVFFQNMEKGKFKGYGLDQFAVDFWRFFQSDVSSTQGGYRIRLNPGRNNALWLLDLKGEKRQITHVLFGKSEEGVLQ